VKKFSSRERTILKMMAFVLAVAGAVNLYDWYVAERQSLTDEIESKNAQIAAFLEELEDENADFYSRQVDEIERKLLSAQDRILELPQETDAKLLISKTISEQAERAGMTVNSISNRRSVPIEGSPMLELRTYFAYDTELESFLEFFQALDNQGYYIVIETLNLSSRRSVYRRGRRNIRNRPNIRRRASMSGNAVVATLFQPNPQANLNRYQTPASDGGADAPPPPPPPPETIEPEEEMEEGGLSEMVDNLDADEGALNADNPIFGGRGQSEGEEAAPVREGPRPTNPMQVKPRPLSDTAKERDAKKIQAKKRF